MSIICDVPQLTLKPVTVEDFPYLVDFIHQKADYDQLEVSASRDDLYDALFGVIPAAYALMASVDGEPVGYTLYCFTFSSMTGKRTLWLDDLFVKSDYRCMGIDAALVSRLKFVAKGNGCGRLECIVRRWNTSAIAFYKRMGAQECEQWRLCRMDEASLSMAVEEPAPQLDLYEGANYY